METVSEENKGLIWGLLKQLRPGMDLSKVVLPTFILEPRSFLDKLSDYYYHADLLSQSVLPMGGAKAWGGGSISAHFQRNIYISNQ